MAHSIVDKRVGGCVVLRAILSALETSFIIKRDTNPRFLPQ